MTFSFSSKKTFTENQKESLLNVLGSFKAKV